MLILRKITIFALNMQIKVIKKHKGIGDSIAAVSKVLYADKIAEVIAKGVGADDCGCEARQEALNNPDLLINKLLYGSKQVE
jgi:hypothetical protein